MSTGDQQAPPSNPEGEELRRSTRIQMQNKRLADLIKSFWSKRMEFGKTIKDLGSTLGDINDEEALQEAMMSLRIEKLDVDALYEEIVLSVTVVPLEIKCCFELLNKEFDKVMYSLVKKTAPSVSSDSLNLENPVETAVENEKAEDQPNATASSEISTDSLSLAPDSEQSVQSVQVLARSLSDSIRITQLPAPEPEIFTGDPLKFTMWKSAFATLVESKNIPPSEKIHYLQRYLAGEAKECVSSLFFFDTEEAYRSAWKLLEKRYGNSFLIVEAFRQRLNEWPDIQSQDHKGLRKIADFLTQCTVAKEQIPGLNILDDCHENRRLLQKFPRWIQNEWAKKVADSELTAYPTFKEFSSFILKIADRVNNPILTSVSKAQVQSKKTAKSLKTVSRATVSYKNKGVVLCKFCKLSNHILHNCRKFREISAAERKTFLMSKGMCFSCLRFGHRSSNCKNCSKCDVCSELHPTCLHGDSLETVNVDNPAVEVAASKSTKANIGKRDLTSMVLPVYLSSDSDSKEHLVYAMLDSQSDTTFVLKEAVDNLTTQSSPACLKISTITSETTSYCRKYNDLKVRAFNSDVWIKLPPTYSRDFLPANRENIPTLESVTNWEHLKQLEGKLPPPQKCEVALLIGFDCPEALAPLEVILGHKGEPFAQRTTLGWCVVGSTRVTDKSSSILVVPEDLQTGPEGVKIVHRTRVLDITNSQIIKSLESDFEDIRDSEEKMLSQDDLRFLEIMKDGIKQDSQGFYEMPLPFKSNDPELPNNRDIAFKRFGHLQKRFKRDEEYSLEYQRFMSDILRSGDAELVPDIERPLWYVPHHGVFHPKKRKLRVVFDCSAVCQGTSLNQILLQGPDQMNGLIGVLCRFREEHVAISSDIERMFHRFRVSKEHRNFLCFLWFKHSDPTLEIKTFRMNVHLFGATSSPACAIYGLKKIAVDIGAKYGAEVARFLHEDFYMDDGLTSCVSSDNARDLVNGAVSACAEANIRLHKFLSNDKSLMEEIPDSEKQDASSVSLNHLSDVPLDRVLGILWCVDSDEFQFKFKLEEKPTTRRGVLSTIASIYDPLGWLSPFVLLGKKLLQDLCRSNAKWDDKIPDTLLPRWEDWLKNIDDLDLIKIPRCFKPRNFTNVVNYELHHFADASLSGYGACSYIRMVSDTGQIHCALVLAKARVSPLKGTTIPRLELTAALLAVKLSVTLRKEMRYPVKEFFWTDSQIVLGYVRNSSKKFHMFVANRVKAIQEKTDVSQWNYIKSEENPADHASRGLTVSELNSSFWLRGPPLLWKSSLEMEKPSIIISADDPEVRHVLQSSSSKIFNLDRFLKFSDFSAVIKGVAVIHSFLYRSKQLPTTVNDRREAEFCLWRLLQSFDFSEEIDLLRLGKPLPEKNRLTKLDPFIDETGLLRVGGRLDRASLSFETRHPIILPKSNHLVELLVKYCHNRICHQGRGFTINEIRSRGYWIFGCNKLVSSVIYKCVTCRKLRGKPMTQKMGDLPSDRVEPSPPFTYCGIDCFGPFIVRDIRKENKRYGMIVTCLASRAVHLELLDDMSTDALINALRCVIAIRGPIRLIRCDQGSNLMGAQRELKSGLQEIKDDVVKNFLAQNHCDFMTNPPHASHMGGAWERHIRTVRTILSSILEKHSSRLDTSTLRTFLYEVMSIMNCRPLTSQDLNDHSVPEPLTPNHLVTMKSQVVLPPPGDFVKEDVYARKRWRKAQFLAEEFWARWRKSYLLTLQPRSKWKSKEDNLRIDDVVLLKDENLIRSQFKLARVVEANPDADGLVRRVKVFLGNNTILERPIHKLLLLVRHS